MPTTRRSQQRPGLLVCAREKSAVSDFIPVAVNLTHASLLCAARPKNSLRPLRTQRFNQKRRNAEDAEFAEEKGERCRAMLVLLEPVSKPLLGFCKDVTVKLLILQFSAG